MAAVCLDVLWRILLHICCGPCSVHILKNWPKIWGDRVFLQSNIYRRRIFRRLKAMRDSIDAGQRSKIDWGPYDSMMDENLSHIKTNRKAVSGAQSVFASEWRAVRYAKKTLWCLGDNDHVRRNKRAEVINSIAGIWLKNTAWNFSPRLEEGRRAERSREICKENNIYRQNYCGCVWSIAVNKSSLTICPLEVFARRSSGPSNEGIKKL